VLALSVTNFVYFYTFHGLRAFRDTRTAYSDFICGSIAGVVAVLISNPFWVANTRLKLQGVAFKAKEKGEAKERRFTSVLDCFLRIKKHEGWKELWSGTASSLALISNPSIQYSCYEYLKRSQLGNTAISGLINGALSKLVATMLTYPLQVIQTQRRAGHLLVSTQRKKRSSLLSIVDQGSTIIKRDGLVGLFRGLESKLLQTVLSAALMFCIYEELANVVFSVAGVER
jgi:adenine nucleotide transporter 17